MKSTVIAVFTALSSVVAFGCTAITSFDNPPATKIDIKEEVGETIPVMLDGSTGEIALLFESDLPVEAQDDIYELIGSDSEIRLQVTNEESLVSVFLTDTPVDTVPSAPGEYRVEVADNGLDVTIVFYNESLAGQMLRAGGDYSALLTVAENDWFETGAFSFDVTVE